VWKSRSVSGVEAVEVAELVCRAHELGHGELVGARHDDEGANFGTQRVADLFRGQPAAGFIAVDTAQNRHDRAFAAAAVDMDWGFLGRALHEHPLLLTLNDDEGRLRRWRGGWV
jgi:hypothetical protein